MKTLLEHAWALRKNANDFARTEAVRVFYGPGECPEQSGTEAGDLHSFAVDRFGENYWVTQWQDAQISPARLNRVKAQIVEFFRAKGAQAVVGLERPERGVAPESQLWWGKIPPEKYSVRENGCHFWIQLEKTRHPGLFLDHEPLRRWLLENAQGWNVLNTFSYTGSLSVAAAVGQARSVTTLDLSKPTLLWAQQNMELNRISPDVSRMIAGDVFEWLPRLKREKKNFDCIILDPPSFSHGKKGRFSTARDLSLLHELAMDVLAPGGVLATSINSENISWKKFEADVLKAAVAKGMRFQVLRTIDLPETFPTLFGQAEARYLKGWILRRL